MTMSKEEALEQILYIKQDLFMLHEEVELIKKKFVRREEFLEDNERMAAGYLKNMTDSILAARVRARQDNDWKLKSLKSKYDFACSEIHRLMAKLTLYQMYT